MDGGEGWDVEEDGGEGKGGGGGGQRGEEEKEIQRQGHLQRSQRQERIPQQDREMSCFSLSGCLTSWQHAKCI